MGGLVVNLALTVDGVKPIGARARRTRDTAGVRLRLCGGHGDQVRRTRAVQWPTGQEADLEDPTIGRPRNRATAVGRVLNPGQPGSIDTRTD